MKNITSKIILALCLFSIFTFGGCKAKNNSANSAAAGNDNSLKIVTTIFPIADWTRNIIGDNSKIKVDFIQKNGADLHNFQPGVEDLLKVAKADLFIYVGGESDEWVEDALKNTVNKNQKTLNLLESLGDKAREEEHFGEADEEHDHEAHNHEAHNHEAEGHDHEEKPEMDEHIWLSIKNAELLCQNICSLLCQIDEENASTYRVNAASYTAKLAAIDTDFENFLAASKYHAIVVGDRFPFLYLATDYNLEHYAAFAGCSAETEASFKTVIGLAEKLDELGLPAILVLENSNKKIAVTIRQNTKAGNQKILSINSLQSVTANDAEKGVTYAGIMKKNFETLKEALN